jgi:hypothetical protein
MKLAWRVALMLCFFMVLVGGVSYASPDWSQEVGLDFWNYPALEAELAAQEKFQKELWEREEAVQRVLAFRCALTADLVENRISFEEAHAHFVALNEAETERSEAVQLYFPSSTIEESTRQQLLSYVTAQIGRSPEQWSGLSADLRDELRTYRPAIIH